MFAQPPLSARTPAKPVDADAADDDTFGDGTGPHWSDIAATSTTTTASALSTPPVPLTSPPPPPPPPSSSGIASRRQSTQGTPAGALAFGTPTTAPPSTAVAATPAVAADVHKIIEDAMQAARVQADQLLSQVSVFVNRVWWLGWSKS